MGSKNIVDAIKNIIFSQGGTSKAENIVDALDDLSKNPTTGNDSEIFVVHFKKTTFQEIINAVEKGKCVVLVDDSAANITARSCAVLAKCSYTEAVFFGSPLGLPQNKLMYYTVTSNNEYSKKAATYITTETLAQSIPLTTSPAVGQYLRVAAVDGNGKISALETIDAI